MTLHAVYVGSHLPTAGRCSLFSTHDSAINFAPAGTAALVSIVAARSAMTVSSILLDASDFIHLSDRIRRQAAGDVSLCLASSEGPGDILVCAAGDEMTEIALGDRHALFEGSVGWGTLSPRTGDQPDDPPPPPAAGSRNVPPFRAAGAAHREIIAALAGAERAAQRGNFAAHAATPTTAVTASLAGLLLGRAPRQTDPIARQAAPASLSSLLLGPHPDQTDPLSSQAASEVVPLPNNPFARRAADAILPSLQTQDPPLPDPTRLVGLGPGMTPSGDDYLVGFLAGLESAGCLDAAHTLSEQIRPLLARTTRPGATILAHAVERCFPAYLCDVVELVAGGRTADAVEAAGRHGATSGLDALAGLAVALAWAENTASAQT